MTDLYDTLEKLNIEYEEISHSPVYTIEEAKQISRCIEGKGCKSLFLKRKNKYYLVLIEEDKRADLKQICRTLGVSQLSFAGAENLKEILGLEQGSVTPLGIVNDYENKVLLLIDKELKGEKLLLHPNTNTKTISVSYEDLIRFVEEQKHSYIEI